MLRSPATKRAAALCTDCQGCPQDVKSQDRDEIEKFNPQDVPKYVSRPSRDRDQDYIPADCSLLLMPGVPANRAVRAVRSSADNVWKLVLNDIKASFFRDRWTVREVACTTCRPSADKLCFFVYATYFFQISPKHSVNCQHWRTERHTNHLNISDRPTTRWIYCISLAIDDRFDGAVEVDNEHISQQFLLLDT